MKRLKKLMYIMFPILSLALIFPISTLNGKSEQVSVHADSHNHNGWTAWSTSNSLPSSTGRYYLTTDVTLSSTYYLPNNSITICLNGHGIRGDGSKQLIYLGQGKTLNLHDCNSTNLTHKFSVANAKSNGAGLATVNDNLTSNYKTFEGGYLTGGKGKDSYSGGSAIYVRGTFNFYGGTIIGNKDGYGTLKLDSASGGRGIVNMSGGAICYNTASKGGAICLEKGTASGAQDTEVNITGGEIAYNFAGDGGAIHANQKLTIRNASIHDNASNNYGIIGNYNFSVGTDTYIYNNIDAIGNARDIYFNNKTMTLTGALNKDAKVHKCVVTMASTTGTFATGWNSYMSDRYAPYYFESSNSNYTIGLASNNDVAIGNYHVHNWTYTAKDNVITASCDATGCDIESQTVTLNVSDKVYDGTAVTASTSTSGGWLGKNGFEDPLPSISYSGNTEIGSYEASLTIGGATAKAAFSILSPCDHDFVYSADGNTISAECSKDCALGVQTLTINATGKVYDGTPVVATITASSGWTSTNKLPDIPEIVYSGNTNAGTYTVSITVNNLTASCEFTIVKATPTPDPVTDRNAVYGQSLSDIALPDGWTWNTPTDKVGNAGNNQHKATFSLEDPDNYNTVEQNVNVIVAKADPEYIVPTGLIALANKTLSTVTLPAGWTWDDPTQNVGSELGNKVFKATFTPEDTVNYNVIEHVDITVLVTVHDHNWSYTASGATITASCSNANCPVAEGLTLELQAPANLTYDGNAKAATFKAGYSIEAFQNPTIKYYQGTSEVDSCVNVGTYVAKVTYSTATAELEFTILPVTDSAVDVVGGDSSDVVVSGLSDEISALINQNPTANYVSVSMTVESKTQDTAESGEQIAKEFDNKVFKFFDVKLEKTIDSEKTQITETTSVIEIGFKYDKINKRDISVYSYHDNSVRTFVESDTKADGTFRLDKDNSMVYVYTRTFSTYAITYTPYYKVTADLSFNTFDGNVNVSLEKQGEVVYSLENVDAKNIVFADVAMGEYIATVSWADGEANTSVSFYLTIGPGGVVITPIVNS